jgi:hypothetical protein
MVTCLMFALCALALVLAGMQRHRQAAQPLGPQKGPRPKGTS